MYLSLFLSHHLLCAPAFAQPTPPKITVIGAGLAGLTAAHRLQAWGYPVEVYEARTRPGGRICTAYFGSSYEELGGKNLDDASDATEILELIRELGLKIRTGFTGTIHQRMTFLNGEMQPFLLAFKDAPEPTEAAFTALREKIDETKSLADLLDLFLSQNPVVRQQMDWMMSGYEGSSTTKLTPHYLEISFWKFYKKFYEASHSLADEETPSIHRSVEGGNSRLIKALADSLKGSIHYGSPLKEIRSDPENGRLYLDVSQGACISTDYLILALPASTLRDVKIQARLIPDDQMDAIQTLQYGSNAKMLLPVKIPDGNVSQFLITDTICNWFNHDHTVMTWYYIGEKGDFDGKSTQVLAGKLNREIAQMQQVYQGIQFPYGLTPCPKIEALEASYHQPVGISWIHEEFSKGSYSNYGIEHYARFREVCEDQGETVLRIFRPIQDRIFFAGEHTDIEDFATMGGAVRSGEKAARMLRRNLQKNLKFCIRGNRRLHTIRSGF